MTTETATTSDLDQAPMKLRGKRKLRQSEPVPHETHAPADPTQAAGAAPTEPGVQGVAEMAAASQASASKPPAKSTTVLKLLRRKRGATIVELQEATEWQAHSVRGFLSGTLKKRMGLEVASEIGADGIRRYSVAKA